MLDNARKWILEQGYPLEMRAAKAFRDGGFEVHQSEVYYDDDLHKSREIDLAVIAPDFMGLTKISFSVECKSSKKPWILFGSKYAVEGTSRFFTYAVMSKTSTDLLAEIASNDPANTVNPIHIDLFRRLKWMRKGGIVGYSLRQAFTDVDNAYAALASAMKAACHMNRPGTHRDIPYFRIVFPVVIIDAPLISCSLDEHGELSLEEIDSGEVVFTAPDQERITTCVRIVTIERLAEFVAEAKTEIGTIRNEFRTKEREVWKELFGSEYPF